MIQHELGVTVIGAGVHGAALRLSLAIEESASTGASIELATFGQP